MSSDRPRADPQQPSGRSPRVAVDVLIHDQQTMLFHGNPDRKPPLSPLVDGFEDRRALINWWQAAAVRTFGHLSSVYPATAILSDGNETSALLGDHEYADRERQRLLERVLQATRVSYRDLEVRATEWLSTSDRGGGDDYHSIDPTEQRHVAMRPAFSRLDAEQATVLADLWGGLEDRMAVSRWTHSLPSVADFSEVLDADLSTYLARSDHAREMLMGDGEEARAYRERFAAGLLLPAMAKRARKLRAAETPSRKGTDNPWNKPRGDSNGT